MGAHRKTLGYLIWLFVIALWPTLSHAAQTVQKNVKVRISQSAVSARSTVLWIAQERACSPSMASRWK